jgi:hypothetical protein
LGKLIERTMTALRQRVHLLAVTVLLLQLATLSAFVPQDCCPAHQARTVSPKPCHEEPPPATYCPMRGTSGAACPMHASNQPDANSGHEHHSLPPTDDCSMRGTCKGPMSAMLNLLSTTGILPDEPLVVSNDDHVLIAARVAIDPVRRFVPPDPPPPRV